MTAWGKMTPAQRDQLVAERVAGWERHDCEPFPGHASDDIYTYWTMPESKGGTGWHYDADELPRYSQDISAAFGLVEQIRQTHPLNNLHLVIYTYNRTYATFDPHGFDGKHEDLFAEGNGDHATEEAVCQAALKLYRIAI